jgi:hypothetical protein
MTAHTEAILANLGTRDIQDITAASPDFAGFYSVNANLSVSREFARDTGLTIRYPFTRDDRLPVMRNINLVPSGRMLADGGSLAPRVVACYR